MQLYHNPRCAKSREALKFLQDKGMEVDIIDYIKNPPSKAEFKRILKKLGIKAEELLRKNEKLYKEEYKEKSLKNDEWIQVMLDNPKLMERPIFINGEQAVLARPADKIQEIL